jgi:hypothetical protein
MAKTVDNPVVPPELFLWHASCNESAEGLMSKTLIHNLRTCGGKMKRLLSIVALLGLTGLGFSLPAVAQNQPAQNQAGSQQQQMDTQSARTFEGKITKAGDKLVLQDTETRQAYQLDDQDKAKQFEGKNVKVTATMDPNTNTLHVVDIAAIER